MKHLLLITFLIVSSFTAAQAGSSLSKSANDSAIAAGRIALNSKIAQFNTAATASATSVTSQQSAKDVCDLMRAGLAQTMHSMELEQTKAGAQTINTRYLQLERATSNFVRMMPDIATNRAELLRQAQAFYSNY